MFQSSSPTALEVFSATMIVSAIRGVLCDSASLPRRSKLPLELTEDRHSTIGFEPHISEWPIFIVLESPNEVLSKFLILLGICYHSVWLGETGGFLPIHWKFMMVLSVPFNSDSGGTLRERLGKVIDRFLARRWSTLPAERGHRRRWSLEWEMLTGAWHFVYSYDGTSESGFLRPPYSGSRKLIDIRNQEES